MLLSQASTVFCLRVLSLPDGSYALIYISPKRKQQKNEQNVTTLLYYVELFDAPKYHQGVAWT